MDLYFSGGVLKGEAKSLDTIGLPHHSGPKRKDFLTIESRKASFAKWPTSLSQKPQELAEAGFFYCG